MKRWKRIVLTCTALALLLVIPVTRDMIILILPLGSGIDDLIVIILFFIVCLVLCYRVLASMAVSFSLWILDLIDADADLIETVEKIKIKLNK